MTQSKTDSKNEKINKIKKETKWSLYEEKSLLQPLRFSNGKTQEDIVKEIIKEIEKGTKIILLKGQCGTGKSAIALNLAKNFKKTSIVVPIKSLQKQYEEDYMNKKYILKDDNKRLVIKIIKGRTNFKCPFIHELDKIGIISEKNSTLFNFGAESKKDFSANNPKLPCKIEIKEENMDKLKIYLNENPYVKSKDFDSAKKIRRFTIAPICPYWSPLLPESVDLSKIPFLKDSKTKEYQALETKYKICKRNEGCGYYDQYDAYAEADVIIFNSQKYKLENLMNRKPRTDIEIIDECDEFLDSFANIKKINLSRMYFSLVSLYYQRKDLQEHIKRIIKETLEVIQDPKTSQLITSQEITPLKENKMINVIKALLEIDIKDFVLDEENYLFHCEEVAHNFKDLFEETYLSFEKQDKEIVIKIVTTNLSKKIKKELLEKNKVIIMMSGTVHSEEVLKKIFGIEDFKIIEAETQIPGQIIKLKTGMEINCKYENFKKNIITREKYLKALNKCISIAPRPLLVQINSVRDLPSKIEKQIYNLEIETAEEYKEKQANFEEEIRKFKKKEIKILYTTKCNRGIDFPGDICNSIVLTRYPYPDVNSLFWKVLKKTNPSGYKSFYVDKAKREALQKIYRGLRSKTDRIYLLSPDIRVFSNIP